MTTLRWAVVGTGFISSTMIEAIEQSGSSRVDLIAGRNADVLAEHLHRYSIPRSTLSFDEAVSDPEIDAVYIGLPNHVHHEVTLAAAAAGKAVLSEKSLTTTMADAHALADGVRDAGTFFVEGLMYLAHPLYLRVSELLLDGRLGGLRSVRGSYAAPIAHLVNPLGMGTIFNLGCYPVSLLHFVVQTMCGDDAFAARSSAAVGNRSDVDGTVIDAALSVRFGNGVLATVQSTDSYGMSSEFAISGDKGVLRFDTNPWLPVAGRNTLTWLPFEGDPETIAINDEFDAFYHQVKMVERRVAERQSQAERPSPRLSDSIEIMELLTEWEELCD
jgi:predicted dehydrogenase